LNHYDNPAWTPYVLVACAGAFLILAGIVLQIVQLVVSIRTWRSRRDLTGDPWGGRTFEWSVASPPPVYNFALTPEVDGLDTYWRAKDAPHKPPTYEDIELPTNSPTGVLLAFCAVAAGFAVVWHIWWLALGGFAAGVAVLIASSWREHPEYVVHADEVAAIERRARITVRSPVRIRA
jgi:cytochrome o ubiquinol oxidase subunit 1